MATKSSTKSKPRSNRTAAAKAAKTRAANQEQLRRQREARGVLLIAAGVLLGVYLLVSGTGVLGAFLSELLFGLCGWFAYVLPVVLLAAGILTIAGSHGTGSGSTGWTATGVVAAMTLAQTALHAVYKGVPYIAYLSAAYETGAAYPHRGGGALGALLCYPLQQLGGAALAYVLSSATLLIVILMVTRLSLRDMSARVNRTVHTAVERVRSSEQRRMPVYDLQQPAERDVPAEPAAPAKKARYPPSSARSRIRRPPPHRRSCPISGRQICRPGRSAPLHRRRSRQSRSRFRRCRRATPSGRSWKRPRISRSPWNRLPPLRRRFRRHPRRRTSLRR